MLLQLFVAALVAAACADDSWYDDPNTLPDRQTMVHLFEWKWTDIAKECEDFLQYYGYGAVQISPPTEHITLTKNGDMPWWIRYQPVCYELSSRGGTRAQLVDMINRCNKVGVRIIVDTVLNHMCGNGQKKGAYGVGSSGNCDFDGTLGVESFPGIGFSKNDMNDYRCNHDIQGGDYSGNANNVRNCRLVGLIDLDQGKENVREKLVNHLNGLVDLGVAGFRLDASKHMWPGDLKAILDRVKNLRSDIFGENKRPFVVHEVIDRGSEAVSCKEYVNVGRYTDFNYGSTIAKAAWKQIDFSDLKWWGPGYGYGNLDDHDVLAFIDNHDNQRDSSPYVPTYKRGDQYAMSVGFMLSWNYGFPRVMSSYYFSVSDQGPPSYGASQGFATKSPSFNADKSCAQSSGWVCEHRWQAIRGMALFRKIAIGAPVDNVATDAHRLGFARKGKGFFALNNGNGIWKLTAQTSLPSGAYCDVWSGELSNGACTGTIVNVLSDGTATFSVPQGQFMAIHIGAKL